MKREEIEIRIREVSPEDLSISQLFDLAKAAEDAVLGAVPESVAVPEIRISLVRITRQSTVLSFATPAPQVVRPAFEGVAIAVRKGDASTLPVRARSGLKRMQEFTRHLGKVLELRLPTDRRRPLAEMTPAIDLFAYTASLLEGETELFGKVERVGGATPRVALRVAEKLAVYCDVSMEIAKELGHHLYSWVGVAGKARWNPFDGSIETFRVERLLPYEEVPITQAVVRLAEAVGKYWGEVRDVVHEITTLREDEVP